MWNQLPPIQSLKLFDSVVRNRSMTRAAAEAGISQSAVSQSIRHLEQFLQTPLLDRSSRPMGLTEEGETFHRNSTEALARLAQAVEDLRKRGRKDNDAVTISCNLGFATYWLMPRLNYFSAIFPDIVVNVMAAYHSAAGFQSGADVAIRYGNGDWSDGDWQLLFKETIGPMCSSDYLKRVGPITGPTQLANQRLIHVTVTDPDWLDWEQYFNRIGHDTRGLSGGLRFSNYVQAIQAALTGDGIMLGWRSVVGDLLNSQQLTLAFDAPIRLDSGYYIKGVQDQDDGDCVGALLSWLREQAGKTPDL
jgi:DNA-binding transcriptional LysR family regulator